MKILLKEIRKKKKMSLQKLSILTGISLKQLSKIECQYVNPKIGTLVKIAVRLNVSLDELVLIEENDKKEE